MTDHAQLEAELAELEARASRLRRILDEPPSTKDVAYPKVVVQLTGQNGNAIAILGRVDDALIKHGVDRHQRAAFQEEAMSGDYNHLLRTVMEWVTTY